MDMCCFNRPFDEQTQHKILIETEANLFIQNLKENYSLLHQNLLKNVNSDEINKIYNSLEVLVEIFKKWTSQK